MQMDPNVNNNSSGQPNMDLPKGLRGLSHRGLGVRGLPHVPLAPLFV